MRVLPIIKNDSLNGVTTWNRSLLAELERRGHETMTHCTDTDEARDYAVDIALLNNREGVDFTTRHVDANRHLFFVHSLMNPESLPPIGSLNLEVFVFGERARDFLLEYHPAMIRNSIDMAYFKPVSTSLQSRLISVLDLRSGGLYVSKIRRAAKILGMWVDDLSLPTSDVRPLIKQSDVCIAYGRHAIEALSMGRRVIIYGINGGDGLVTEGNISRLAETNFSGWSLRSMPPPDKLLKCKF